MGHVFLFLFVNNLVMGPSQTEQNDYNPKSDCVAWHSSDSDNKNNNKKKSKTP